jgi:nucleotide-binding universal stress UspA family protein
MYRTIIAGCNGRERGRGAVSLAHAIASATGARLVLVGVHHHPPLPFPGSYASQREELEHELRAIRDELAPEALIRLEGDLSPAHALRRVANAEAADLLVVGSRHRRRLQRIVEGDQAMQVLHGAPCAVAVAPDPVAPRPSRRSPS